MNKGLDLQYLTVQTKNVVMSLDFASKDCSVYGKSGLLLASQIYATVLNSLL